MLDLREQPGRPLVAASILSADFGRIADEARSVLAAGADLLHVDVMDGHFVPNLTMGADMIRGLRKHCPDAVLDVHLMVEKPAMFIEPFAEAGATTFTFHVEVCQPHWEDGRDAGELIGKIHAAGMTPGLVINPPTPIDAMETSILPWADRLGLVLVMSVNPGYSGQSFMPETLAKTRWLADRLPGHVRLEMDGGIKPDNAAQVRDAGCDMIVAASAIFGAADRAAAIAALRGEA